MAPSAATNYETRFADMQTNLSANAKTEELMTILAGSALFRRAHERLLSQGIAELLVNQSLRICGFRNSENGLLTCCSLSHTTSKQYRARSDGAISCNRRSRKPCFATSTPSTPSLNLWKSSSTSTRSSVCATACASMKLRAGLRFPVCKSW